MQLNPGGYVIPLRDEWEITWCTDCRKRRRISFPPYCQMCWYAHIGELSSTLRWAVKRHIFDKTVKTCGHRHMSWASAAECAFSLMDRSVKNDPKAIAHWLGRIIVAPEE